MMVTAAAPRQLLHLLTPPCSAPQRCWRGFRGRLRAQTRREVVAAGLRQAYFDAAATRIQSHWRGTYSRRVKHNFYKRKVFLEQVLNATVALRADMAAAHEQQLQRCQQEARSYRPFEPTVPHAAPSLHCAFKSVFLAGEAARETACHLLRRLQAEATDLRRFEESLKGQHHLLSTATKARAWPAQHTTEVLKEADLGGLKCTPATPSQVGVFRARYWQQGEAGDAIEQKLRGAEEHGWAATIGKQGGVVPAGPPRPRYRATIASTEPYSADKERASVDRAVERMLACHPSIRPPQAPFAAAGWR